MHMKQGVNLRTIKRLSMLIFVILTVVYAQLIFRIWSRGWPISPTVATGSLAHKWWVRTTSGSPARGRAGPTVDDRSRWGQRLRHQRSRVRQNRAYPGHQ